MSRRVLRRRAARRPYKASDAGSGTPLVSTTKRIADTPIDNLYRSGYIDLVAAEPGIRTAMIKVAI
jgi:hypothetical protein